MSTDLRLEFEKFASGRPKDETDYALRSYVAGLSEDHLAEYRPDWTDEQVMDWDSNFRSDGALMLVCCERDVDVGEFRETVEEFLRFHPLP